MLCHWQKPHIVTARKRSLGQGNVFTPVCHSFHSCVYVSKRDNDT